MALGRGLSELLGEVEVAYENNTQSNANLIQTLDLQSIKTNPYQPRKIFDEIKLNELKDSILEHGLLQPIIVTKIDDQYILVAGERRLRASKLANLDTIDAIVVDIEDKKLREYALIENIQRDDLNILETAYSYQGLIKDYNITHEELANIVKKSRSSVTNTLRLLTLSVYTQKMISASKITFGHAKLLIGLSQDMQQTVVDSIIGQKLSVKDTQILINNLKNKNNSKNMKVKSSKYNFEPLNNVVELLKENELNIKITNNSLNILVNSQEDIEKILNYFHKNNLI